MLEQTNEEKKKKIDTQGLRNAVTNTVENLYQNKIRNVQAKTNAVQPERVQNAQGVNDGKSKSLKDYSIMSPDRQSNGIEADDKPSFEGKKFKSRYIDNNGAWTHEAVDDGYVEFNDYIKDRRDGVDNGISFNGKEFSASKADYTDVTYDERGYEPLTYDYSEVPSELFPYTISENLGETAGVGNFIKDVGKSVWNFADKALEYGGNKVSTAIQSVLKFAKQSPYYDMVVDDVRDIWSWGAEHILRDWYDCQSSAWLLEHALQDNPSNQYRGNDSRIAWLVNTDPNYLSALDAAIKKSNGRTIDTTIDVRFETNTPKGKDLYFSLHNVRVKVQGYKREDGKWIVHSVIRDQYDYTKLMWLDLHEWQNMSAMKALGMTANDVATISSWGDAINPYWLTIDFYTTR